MLIVYTMINFKNATKVQFITEWDFTKKGDYYLLFEKFGRLKTMYYLRGDIIKNPCRQ